MPGENPPIIYAASNITKDSCDILTTLDLIYAGRNFLTVEYGETTNYGLTSESRWVTDYLIQTFHLTGLKPDTTYYFRVKHTRRDVADAWSLGQSFTTLPEEAPPDIPPPDITPGVTHRLTVRTDPNWCTVEVDTGESGSSGETGNITWNNVPEGNRIVVVTRSGYLRREELVPLFGATRIDFDLNPAPEPPADPFGITIDLIITAFESMLGFVSGGFLDVLSKMQHILETFSEDLVAFFNDPITAVRSYVKDIIPTFADWIADRLGEMNSWWTTTKADIGSWWNDSTKRVVEFVDTGYKTLGAWWRDSKIEIMNMVDDVLPTLADWWGNILAGVNSWWNTTQADIGAWWNDATGRVVKFVDTGYQTLAMWWRDSKIEIMNMVNNVLPTIDDLVSTKFISFINWMEGLPGDINNFITTQLVGVVSWVKTYVPDVVEAMLDFLKPIVQPVQDAVEYLGFFKETVEQKRPMPPEWTAVIEENNMIRDDVKQILEALQWQ